MIRTAFPLASMPSQGLPGWTAPRTPIGSEVREPGGKVMSAARSA